MKIRIALIITVLAGLIISGLNFGVVRHSIVKLQGRLKGETFARQRAETELASTSSKLDQTLLGLNQCKASLQATISERDKATGEAALESKRARALTESLSSTRLRLEETQAKLARYEYAMSTVAPNRRKLPASSVR